ncbi:hypothetical protein LRP50_24780 [Enterovibrio sp. ZSDZ42]|uniref:DUF304 domain-containing protein n=1 Tax=Enterovibrio gelatinilyticus TaxID=2899819 RepID=A0ABT5R7U7_9GAMM|nr:hypothetical protein [Enterovibrio sp. ZSDZ42]MDD1796340.1 hypothetical protein [Enterovibrio sp. ZSDZ42]
MKKYISPTTNESLVRLLVPTSGLLASVYFLLSASYLLSLSSLLISVVFFWKSKHNLILLNTKYPPSKTNFHNCKNAAIIYGWHTVSEIDMVKLEFETNASLSSWGELITVLFTSSGILINSRPSPLRRPSLITMGRNKNNLQKLIATLEDNTHSLPD